MTSLLLALALAAGDPPALVDVPAVSLQGMEPAVAQQLLEVRQRLDDATRARRADSALLGEAGSHYHAYELAAPAEACYRNAEALKPGDFRWPYLAAVLYEQTSRLEDAANNLERVLALPDKYYPALIRMAGISLALGRTERAASALEVARKHAPGDPAFLAAAGQLALVQGRAQDAVAELSGALAGRPEATRLHYPLAMAYRALGRSDDARRHLALAGGVGLRAQDPILEAMLALRKGESSFVAEGLRAFRAGDFAGAAAAFERAVDLGAGAHAGPLLNLAAAESKLGRVSGALRHLEQAHALAPDHPGVLFNRGLLLAQVGRPQDAEPLLRRLVESAPEDDAARLEWGLTLLDLGRPGEALAALEPAATFETSRCAALHERLAQLAGGSDAALAARARTLMERLASAGCAL